MTLLHSAQWFSGYMAVKLNTNHKFKHIHSIISSSYERQISGFTLRSKYQRSCEELAFTNADLLLSISPIEKQQLIQQYNIHPNKIIIVGRKVDSIYSETIQTRKSTMTKDEQREFNNLNFKDENWWNNNVFCYVGRIITYKGIKEIILAWDLLYKKYNEKTPPLWIIGGKASTISLFRKELKKTIPNLNYYESIYKLIWWGYLTQEVISGILLKSSVIIMHSAFEPGGRVFLEAMASGKPVLSTNTGFAASYIENGYNGYLVKYKDIKNLSRYMDFFVTNEYLSNMLGINSYRTYKQLNNLWDYYKKLSDIYHSSEDNFSNIEIQLYEPINNYPFLVDCFPYSDIKNNLEDLNLFFDIKATNIEEYKKYHSYIWESFFNESPVIIKQYYNRLNWQQLWNPHDTLKIVSIWILYHTSIVSTKYNLILKPIRISDKLFSYMLPKYTIIEDLKIIEIVCTDLETFHEQESGVYTLENDCSTRNFFRDINNKIQVQYKHYTRNILLSELKYLFDKYKNCFSSQEIHEILVFFSKLDSCFSQKEILYGLNYGKSLLNHVVISQHGICLLPSADIFIGELGYDEGVTLVEYYLKYNSLPDLSAVQKSKRNLYILWGTCLIFKEYLQGKIINQAHFLSTKDIQFFLNGLD